MKLFRRNDPPERPDSITSDEYRKLMLELGRLGAQVETLELKWVSWQEVANRVVARIERRDQRAAKKADTPEANGDPGEAEVDRIIRLRRGRGLPGRLPG